MLSSDEMYCGNSCPVYIYPSGTDISTFKTDEENKSLLLRGEVLLCRLIPSSEDHHHHLKQTNSNKRKDTVLQDVLNIKENLMKQPTTDETFDLLEDLDDISMSADILAKTQIAMAVAQLRRHKETTISGLAKTLVQKWKKAVNDDTGGGEQQQQPFQNTADREKGTAIQMRQCSVLYTVLVHGEEEGGAFHIERDVAKERIRCRYVEQKDLVPNVKKVVPETSTAIAASGASSVPVDRERVDGSASSHHSLSSNDGDHQPVALPPPSPLIIPQNNLSSPNGASNSMLLTNHEDPFSRANTNAATFSSIRSNVETGGSHFFNDKSHEVSSHQNSGSKRNYSGEAGSVGCKGRESSHENGHYNASFGMQQPQSDKHSHYGLSHSSSQRRSDDVEQRDNHFCQFGIPQWLLKDSQTKDRFHDYFNQPCLNQIGNMSNCTIEIRHENDKPDVYIASHSRGRNATKCVLKAKLQFEAIMLELIDNDGSMGRLIYDMALPCSALHHRLDGSTSVKHRDPFSPSNKLVYMNIVELPYKQTKSGKDFHAAFLIDKNTGILGHCEPCTVKICMDRFNIPVEYGDPYVFICGRHADEVDRAVRIVKESIAKECRDFEELTVDDPLLEISAGATILQHQSSPSRKLDDMDISEEKEEEGGAASASLLSAVPPPPRNSIPSPPPPCDDNHRPLSDNDNLCRVHFPPWLVYDSASKDRLFLFLTRKPNHLNNIGLRSHCTLEIKKWEGSGQQYDAVFVVIKAKQGVIGDSVHSIQAAKEQLEDLLLEYIDFDGSMGRLFYDVAFLCKSMHSHVTKEKSIQQRNPFNVTRATEYINVVELPFSTEQSGEPKNYHGAYLTSSRFGTLSQMKRETGCTIKICGDDFRVPLRYCAPYVFIFGGHANAVDRAVEIIKVAIRNHMKDCKCTLKEENTRHRI
eukprot:scaffold15216_cov241-Alexandrium_tamarense.AAC.2